MTLQTLTLQLPGLLFQRLKNRADKTKRSVEDETLEVLASAIAVTEDLPPDLAEAISPLSLLDDEALRRAARSHLGTEAASQMEELHQKRQRQGISDKEEEILSTLVRQFERAILIRSHAVALLHQRGKDIAGLNLPL